MAGGASSKIKGGVAAHNEAVVTDGAIHVQIEGGGGSTTNHNLLLNLVAPNDDHTQYYHIDGRRALTGDMDAGGFDLANITLLGVGVAAPVYPIDLVGSNGVIRFASVTTDATYKQFQMVCRHYTNAEENIIALQLSAFAAENRFYWGGGSASFNTATSQRFYAAANSTTTTGTEMARLTTTGLRLQSGVAGNASYLLHVVSGASGGAAGASADDLVIENAGAVGIGLLSTTTCSIFMGDAAASAPGRVVYTHATDHLSLFAQNSEQIRLDGTGVRIQDGVAAAPSYPLHVVGQTYINQSNASGAIPCLELDQDDTDEEFIEFDGTSAASAAASISSWTSGNTIQGFVRVTINGTDRWIPFYDDPTS